MLRLLKQSVMLLSVVAAVTAAPIVSGQDASWRAGGADAPFASKVKRAVVTPVREIVALPARFAERDVTVSGIFRGWKWKCPSSGTLTRNDWCMEDGTGCLFVSGMIVKSLSPNMPRGERIVVKGHVKLTKEGKPVIKASRIILLNH
jgi:hypothetical protein